VATNWEQLMMPGFEELVEELRHSHGVLLTVHRHDQNEDFRCILRWWNNVDGTEGESITHLGPFDLADGLFEAFRARLQELG